MTWALIIGLSAVGIYIGVCLGYWALHRFFAIFPSSVIDRLPPDFGLEYDQVFFHASDGTRLQGWFLFSGRHPTERTPRRPLIVFFSGNSGTLSKFLPGFKQLVDSGLDVFAFSYRKFGESDRRWPTETGVYRDSEGALRYLTEQGGFTSSHLILYGQSLGCAMAGFVAARRQPAGLILEAGFSSLGETAARHVKGLPIRFLTTAKFDTRRHLSRVQCPVLIAHSPDDPAIPASDAQALFDAANHPKRRVTIKGLHAKGLETEPESYIAEIHRFISDINAGMLLAKESRDANASDDP